MVAAGDYRFGADTGRLLIRTYRTGLGSRAGHDLTIEVTMWHGTAAVGADASASSVALRIDADSFEIRQGRGGIKPFTDADRADIRKTIQGLLDTARYPSITFESAGSVECSQTCRSRENSPFAPPPTPFGCAAASTNHLVNRSCVLPPKWCRASGDQAVFGILRRAEITRHGRHRRRRHPGRSTNQACSRQSPPAIHLAGGRTGCFER